MSQPNPLDVITALGAQQATQATDPDAWSRTAARIQSKQQELERARQQKISALEAATERQKTAEQSWAGQLGLHKGSVSHGLVNTAASVATGAARAAGNLATAPIDVGNLILDSTVPEEVKEAYGRHMNDQATPEDMGLLFAKGNAQNDSNYAYIDRIRDSQKRSAVASGIADTMDLSGTVDQTARQAMSADLLAGGANGLDKLKNLSKTWDDSKLNAAVDFITGATELILNAGATALTNPMAMAEYTAEMIPDLLLGAMSRPALAVRNIGYGIDNYRQGIEKYQAENNGALPDQDTRRWMLTNAIGASAAEMLSDVSLLDAGKRLLGKGATGAGVEALKEAAKTSRLARVGAAGARGTLVEAATEGFQSYAEGEASLTPATAEEIYEGATIGAGVGGAVSTAIAGGAAAAQANAESTNRRKAERVKQAAQDVFTEEAAKTGDIGPLLDKEGPAYNPSKAAAALREHAQSEQITPQDRTEAKDKLSGLVDELTQEHEALKGDVQEITPEFIAKRKKQLAKFDEDLRQLEEGSQEYIDLAATRDQIAELIEQSEGVSKEARTSLEQQLVEVGQHLSVARQELDMVIGQDVPSADEVADLVKKTTEEAPEAAPEKVVAAKRLVELAMADPDAFTDADIDAILSSNYDGYSADTKTLFRKMSDARVALNELKNTKSVNNEVLNGGPGFKGLSEYRQGMNQALYSSNRDAADREIRGLRAFLASHSNKSATMPQAIEMLKRVGAKVKVGSKVDIGKWLYMARDYSGDADAWTIVNRKPSQWKGNNRQGGFIFSSSAAGIKGAETVAKSVQAEVKAIQATLDQLEAAYALKFNSADTPKPKAKPAKSAATDKVKSEPKPASKVATEAKAKDAAESVELSEQADTPQTSATEQVHGDAPIEETFQHIEQDTEQTSGILEDIFDELNQKDDTGIPKVIKKKGGTLKGNLPADEYRERNQLEYFTQREYASKDLTENPLVAVKDFVSTLAKGVSQANKYLRGSSLNVRQTKALKLFTKVAKSWNPKIKANVVNANKNAAFRYEDFLQYLANDLPENWQTAISAAAFTWVTENANAGLYNSEDTLRAILGLKSWERPTPEHWELLGDVGVRTNLAVQQMGAAAAAALNLKASKDAPANVQRQMEISLGAHALGILMQEGLVEMQTIKSPLLNREGGYVAPAVSSKNANGKPKSRKQQVAEMRKGAHTFVRPVRDAEGNLHPTVELFVERTKGAKQIINKLFSIETGEVWPTQYGQKSKQEKIKRTSQKPPSILNRILSKTNKRPYALRKDMAKIRSMLGQDMLELIAGVVDAEGTHIHATNRISVDAKNEGIRRELRQLNDYMQELTDAGDTWAPFYLKGRVWRQHRVGFEQNAINPQTSTIHRFNLSQEAWRKTIDPTNQQQVEPFLMAVAAGMGIKTDRLSPEVVIEQLEARMAEEDVLAAIAAIKKGENLSTDEQRAIAELAAGAERFHTLDALTNWIAYNEAAGKGKTFVTEMMYEVDGITNGPALAHILLAIASEEDLERFGFYNEEAGFRDYPEWKSAKGNLDIYESMMRDVNAIMASNPSLTQDTLRALVFFTGSLVDAEGNVDKAGRDLIKQPLTSMVFGASVKNTVSAMQDRFVEAFYKKLEAAANSANPKQEIARTFSAAQHLMPSIKHTRKPVTAEQAMEFRLTTANRKELKKSFNDSVGKSIERVMSDRFQTFIDTRKQLNKTSQLAWDAYNRAYKKLYELELSKSIAEERIATADAKDAAGSVTAAPLQELSPERERAIREALAPLMPIVHTPLSILSGRKTDEGIHMAKVVQTTAKYGDLANSAKVKLSPETTSNSAIDGNAPWPVLSVRGSVTQEQDPGVAVMIMLVHSLDSAISALSYETMAALNIHDAHGLSVLEAVQGAKELNKNTFKLLSEYSLPLEMVNALGNTIKGIEQVTKDNPQLAEVFGEQYMADLQLAYEGSKVDAEYIERAKLTQLLTIAHVNQYGLSGGSHEVSAKEREAIQKRLDELGGPVELRTVEQTNPEVSEENKTLYGTLGQPKVTPDNELDSFLRNTENLTIGKTLPMLVKAIKRGDLPYRIKTFQLELIKQVQNTAALDTPIRYITKDSEFVEADSIHEGAFGWTYLDENNKAQINIRGTDFVQSAVGSELVLHEVMHAALAHVIETDKSSPEVKELEALRLAAKKYVEANKLNKQFGPAVSNVHELVAWGLTNVGFQREVLNNVQTTSAVGSRVKESGLRGFIRKLVGILFKGSSKTKQEIAVNGLAVMIANTGLLMEKAQKRQSKPAKTKANPQRLTLLQADTLGFTTEQTFDALGNDGAQVSPKHAQHLRTMLSQVVNAAYGPYGSLKAFAERNATVTAQDTYINSLATGKLPFADSVAQRLGLTEQEGFVAESLHVTLKEALNESQIVRNELYKLFKHAQKNLKPSDFHQGNWADATYEQRQRAESIYKDIFTVTNDGGGFSDYLSRFAALGLTYEPLHKKLETMKPVVANDQYKGLGLAARIKLFAEILLRALGERVSKTYGLRRPDQRLEAMATQLARMEARRKAKLSKTMNKFGAAYESVTSDVTDKVRDTVEKAATSDRVKNSDFAIVRGTGALVGAVAGDRVNAMLGTIKSIRNKSFQEREGMFASLVTELQGIDTKDTQFKVLLRATKKNEQTRKSIKDGTAEMVRDSFATKLDRAESEAVTRAFIRTDAAKLLDEYSLEQIHDLLADSAQLEAALESAISKLSGPHADYYHNAAEALGYFLAHDVAAIDNLMLNAHNIAHLYGHPAKDSVDKAQADAAIPAIDLLASLYAVRHLPATTKTRAARMLTNELKRANTDKGNGVEMVMKAHKELQLEARTKLFDDNPVHFMKGYTKEIFAPYVDIVVATADEGVELIKAGYVRTEKLAKDEADPRSDTYYMYALYDGGESSRITGIASNTGKRQRGSTVHGGAYSINGDVSFRKNKQMNANILAAKAQKFALLDKRTSNWSPMNPKKTHMVPVLDQQGNVVNHRYMMSQATKDNVLKRNSRVDQVIGTMAAHAFDKVSSHDQNKRLIDALYENYKTEFSKRPDAYVEFSENSKDPSVVEAYHLLPDDTKRYIRKVWGKDRMMIRSDLFDLTLGYKKFSLADMIEKNAQVRSATERIMVGVTTHILGDKAALRIRRGEESWQTVVGAVKDFWVVKNLTTMMGNLKFNVGELMLAGVPISDIVKGHTKAFIGILKYQKDEAELMKLEKLLAMDYVPSDRAAMEQRVAELKDALARNPVKTLIDEGLYHTIAEDIDIDTDVDAYKNRIERFTDKQVSKLPEPIQKVGKFMYMTHDTPLYRVLSQGTHIGDFLARYTLYEHMVNRDNKPMPHKEAIEFADQAFVNYDIPTGRGLQYINDMGIIPFTKYYLRMQKVMFNLYRDNPGRAVAMNVLGNYFNWLPDITDPFIWEWVATDPATSGALNYPSAIREAITAKMLGSVL